MLEMLQSRVFWSLHWGNQHNIIKGCFEVPGEFSMHRINIGKSRKKMITRMNLYLQCLLEGYQCLVFLCFSADSKPCVGSRD